MLVVDLLDVCDQSLTANKILVSKLPLMLYRGLKALARYAMSQKLNITKCRREHKWDSSGSEYGLLTFCLDHNSEN